MKKIKNPHFKEFAELKIKAYHEASDELIESFRTINEEVMKRLREKEYTAEHIKQWQETEMSNKLTDFNRVAGALNSSMKKFIENIEAQAALVLTPDKSELPHDYDTRIINAIHFVESEGKDITDETASQILNEFLEDITVMKRFRKIIESQKGESLSDPYGHTTFPKTFGVLTECEIFMNEFLGFKETAANIFIRGKMESSVNYQSGIKMFLPMERYSQEMDELNIIEQGELIEQMITELFDGKSRKAPQNDFKSFLDEKRYNPNIEIHDRITKGQ